MNEGKIGYLGPEGTYSELAANNLSGDEIKVAYPSFFTLFSALEKGEVEAIVIPIENTLNGAVTQNLDLLQETEEVYATSSCALKIDHRLITVAGADKREIKRIYSHGQALAQCAKYLAENFPNAELCETPSTADCISKIDNAQAAGIVGAHCGAEGYELSPRNISDVENNYTQFLLVRRGVPEPQAESQRIFFSVTCRHRAGALVDLLSVLSVSGINMTKIESRPIKNKTGEFAFFIEIEGDYAQPEIKAALKKIETAALSYKLLGCY